MLLLKGTLRLSFTYISALLAVDLDVFQCEECFAKMCFTLGTSPKIGVMAYHWDNAAFSVHGPCSLLG